MLTPAANRYNHRRLPALGETGTINPALKGGLYAHRRCIVIAFPLFTAPLLRCRPTSLGIHTIYVRFLDNQEAQEFSAMHFTGDEMDEELPYG